MTGNPRVLAPLQQANAHCNDHITRIYIQGAWMQATGQRQVGSDISAEIRAWTPPPAEPSLELGTEKTEAQQRYDEANERRYSNREVEMAAGAFDRAEEVAQDLDDWTHLIHMRLNTMSSRLNALEEHPEPTAPDDPCGENCDGSCQKCEDRMFERIYGGDDIPAPQPAPDLDPVRVEEPNIESALKALGYAYQLLPRKHREYDAGAGGHMRDVFRRLTGITHEDAMSNEERIHNELMRLGEGVDRDWR